MPAAPELRSDQGRTKADPAEKILHATTHAQRAMQHFVGQQGLAGQGVSGEDAQHQIAPPGQVEHQNGSDAADDHCAHGNKPQGTQRAGLERGRAQILFHRIADGAGVIGAEMAAVSRFLHGHDCPWLSSREIRMQAFW